MYKNLVYTIPRILILHSYLLSKPPNCYYQCIKHPMPIANKPLVTLATDNLFSGSCHKRLPALPAHPQRMIVICQHRTEQ